MTQDTIAALAAIEPPNQDGTNRISNIGRANARIVELETALGLEPRPPKFNVIRANARIQQLESLLAKSGNATPANVAATPPGPLAIPAPEKIAAAIAPAKNFGLAEIEALHRAIFPGTDAKLRNDAAWSFGADELKAASQKFTAACNQHGPTSPAAKRAERERAQVAVNVAQKKAGTEQEKMNRLLADFAEAGLSIPGVSFAGLKINVNGSQKMPAKFHALATAEIGKFVAALNGDLSALRDHGPAAQAAKKILTEQGKIDMYGRIKL